MASRDDGLAALRAGDARSAVRLLQVAVQEQPYDGVAWGALGVAWCALGEHEQGAAALEEAIRLLPRQASLHYNLGRCREGMGRHAEALDAYREAQHLAPDHEASAIAARRLAASLATQRYGTASAPAPSEPVPAASLPPAGPPAGFGGPPPFRSPGGPVPGAPTPPGGAPDLPGSPPY